MPMGYLVKLGVIPFKLLPINSLTLYWHRHATGAASAAGELIAFESHYAFLVVVDVDLAVANIGSCHYVETGFVDGLDGMLVAGVT